MSNIIERFVRRLNRLGIDVQLGYNVPWVYMEEINGIPVLERFQADHGFTAFFIPVNANMPMKFSDSKIVFKKIRQMLNNPIQDEIDRKLQDQDYYNFN